MSCFSEENYIGLTTEQKEFKVFMDAFMNSSSEEYIDFRDKSLEEYRWLQGRKQKRLLEAAIKGQKFRKMNDIFNHYRSESNEDVVSILEEYYPNILRNMKKLAEELGLSDSIELGNLYSYLLWNGYLSKDKSNTFSAQDRTIIFGMFFTDVINGKSVCLNHSDMLKDFYNACGYDAASLITYLGDDVEMHYRPMVGRNIEDFSLGFKTFNLFMSSFTKKFGNHAFTLVKDKTNGMIIYDSTNLSLFGLKDVYTAEVVNGSGECKLNPMVSSVINPYSEHELRVLGDLSETKNLTNTCSNEGYIETSEVTLGLINTNISLLDDFYDEIEPDIVGICERALPLRDEQKEKLLVKIKSEFGKKK